MRAAEFARDRDIEAEEHSAFGTKVDLGTRTFLAVDMAGANGAYIV
jgi:hypothetical protein